MKLNPMTKEMINNIKTEVYKNVQDSLDKDLHTCILYGSCARGDFTDDSDIDIVLLLNCDRMEAKKYTNALVDISANISLRYFVVLNISCIPYDEFMQKKSWYLYFKNIERDGIVING